MGIFSGFNVRNMKLENVIKYFAMLWVFHNFIKGLLLWDGNYVFFLLRIVLFSPQKRHHWQVRLFKTIFLL